MRLGDTANADADHWGKPLDGVRVLAVEQMQALPFATQLLARLGAEVVKIEPPAGESGRGSQPSMRDPSGRDVGATFLRNNLNKRSVAIDLKAPEGRDLFLRLVPRFDVVAENFKAGTMDRLGLGYDVVAAVHPRAIYVSVSGFGTGASPYAQWPAYASIVEAMSGIYEYMRPPDQPPRANPVGALGDIVTNLASLGVERRAFPQPFILDVFRASDGWFVMQLVREHQFERLARVVERPEWIGDARLATRAGWGEHLDDVLRPGIEAWAATRTKVEAAEVLTAAGVAAGPCHDAAEVTADPHLAARNMLVEMARADGVDGDVIVPGNPVKLSKVAEGPETRVPWVGEHTDEVLRRELGLGDGELEALAGDGVIACQ